MNALLRYQAALLVRSQRWLPPVILYAAFLAIGVQKGQPVLDSLGYTAAALLPVSAWLMRICVTNEPPAARSCTGAAAGPGRAHLACVLVAFSAAALLGTAATVLVAIISAPTSTDHQTRVEALPAAGAGLLAALAAPSSARRRRAHELAPAALAGPVRADPAAGCAAVPGRGRLPGPDRGHRSGRRFAAGGRPGPRPAPDRGRSARGGRDRRGVRPDDPPLSLNRRSARPPATRIQGTA